jgi:hypothetical protein
MQVEYCDEKDFDDFLEVLKWSTDFGVDTESGRELKKGVVPVFAAGVYNTRERVVVGGTKMTLAQHASRMNVKLLRPADFNEKLRQHGVDNSTTVQRICRIAKDEKQVRELMNMVWNRPADSQTILIKILNENKNMFQFEQALIN